MAKKGQTDNYNADSITILEGLEAVRRRPGMYIGSVSTKGLNHLIYEIVDNAVDEHLAGFCSEIHVTLEADGSAVISDKGLSHEKECIFLFSLVSMLRAFCLPSAPRTPQIRPGSVRKRKNMKIRISARFLFIAYPKTENK